MLLTKKYLNEQVQKRVLIEDTVFSRKNDKPQYDVFISYSWNDRSYASKVVQLLEKCGYSVYIDYQDTRLDRNNVSDQTAQRLVNEMKKCKGLLHLYSPSASVSKWCPWEVGIFSGLKNFRCANLPLLESSGDDFKRQEYLELYPYVDFEKVQDSDRYEFWVCESNEKYVSLRGWLSGNMPAIH